MFPLGILIWNSELKFTLCPNEIVWMECVKSLLMTNSIVLFRRTHIHTYMWYYSCVIFIGYSILLEGQLITNKIGHNKNSRNNINVMLIHWTIDSTCAKTFEMTFFHTSLLNESTHKSYGILTIHSIIILKWVSYILSLIVQRSHWVCIGCSVHMWDFLFFFLVLYYRIKL